MNNKAMILVVCMVMCLPSCGQNIMIGEHVTTTKPEGPVLIQNTNVKMKATSVELHPGTTITNSNVEINVPDD